MTPQEVAELSRLLDEGLALEGDAQASWLDELTRSRPEVALRLRKALSSGSHRDATALPELANLELDEAIAQAGERAGSYQLIREIGRGGMGSVWLAERADGAFKRNVALKLPRLTWAAGLGKRMVREREIGALLEHPNIARLYDAGVDERGRPFIAMEYVDGRPIDAYCRENALDLRARLGLFLEVIRAVAYAHGRLVLHRDLKPANVLVDAGRHVHLLDFGIAKLLDDAEASSDLTQEQGRVLTLNYAAPEQIAGRALGVTADVYSLGVMLYELLTGALPYSSKRNTAAAMEEAILAGDAPLASSRVADKRLRRELSGDLDAIVGQAIKRDPAKRYATADAFTADIERYLDGRPITARRDSAWYRLRKAVIRHQVPVLAGLAVLAVTLIGVVTTLVQGQRAAAEAERARLSTAFVSELFRLNATQQSALTDETARARPAVFVDRGAQLIEERFRGQPELQAELYGAVGRVYVDLGIDRLATEYAIRQLVALRAQRASETRIAQSLMLLAEVALSAERDSDAESFAQQAVEVVMRNDPIAPDALALLARTQLRRSRLSEAAESVSEGRRLLQPLAKSNSLADAWLTFVEADITFQQNRAREAWPLYEKAISQAMTVEGPTSTAAIDMRIPVAYRLFSASQYELSQKHMNDALAALEQLGGMRRVRAARVRAELYTNMATFRVVSYSETIAILDKISTFLSSQASTIPPEVLAEIDFRKAWAHVDWGEFALAEPLLESSFPLLMGSTQSILRQFFLAIYQGVCEMVIGKHEAADGHLRQAIDLRGKLGQGNFPFAAKDWRWLALNQSMWGRHHEAEATLMSAPTFADLQGDPLGQYSHVIPQALALVRLNAGDVRGAQEAFPASESSIKENLPDKAAYYQLRGEIRCAAGDHTSGLADLTRSIDAQSAATSPKHPWLARARAVAGLCALKVGSRKQAEELAQAARRAFVAQPNVSPYFKEPLKQLDKQLGV